jgi:putative transposase
MLRTRHSVLDFDPGKQDLGFMLHEAARDLWGFVREDQKAHGKMIVEYLLQEEQKEYLRLQRYERSGSERKGYRAGFSKIRVKTSLGEVEIRRPRLRVQEYVSKILPLYAKAERHLLDLIANMYLVGVSTRKMAKGLESILGDAGISAGSVSRITNRVKERIKAYHHRVVEDKYVFLYLDGLTITVQGLDGKGRKYILLVAYGVDYRGVKELIDFMPVRSESTDNWQGFLFQLYERGLKGKRLKLVIIDGCRGLANALDGIYPRVLRQRCWAHKLRNVAATLKKKDEEACLSGAKEIYKAKSLRHARKQFNRWKATWEKVYPKAVACIEADLDELLTFFLFDPRHWRRLRTTNPIERVIKEFRRRTGVMDNHLPNMDSCEKIFYVVTEFMNERWADHYRLRFRNIESIPENLPERTAA